MEEDTEEREDNGKTEETESLSYYVTDSVKGSEDDDRGRRGHRQKEDRQVVAKRRQQVNNPLQFAETSVLSCPLLSAR